MTKAIWCIYTYCSAYLTNLPRLGTIQPSPYNKLMSGHIWQTYHNWGTIQPFPYDKLMTHTCGIAAASASSKAWLVSMVFKHRSPKPCEDLVPHHQHHYCQLQCTPDVPVKCWIQHDQTQFIAIIVRLHPKCLIAMSNQTKHTFVEDQMWPMVHEHLYQDANHCVHQYPQWHDNVNHHKIWCNLDQSQIGPVLGRCSICQVIK